MFYCFYKINFPRKNAKLFVYMALIKREILTSRKVLSAKSCTRNVSVKSKLQHPPPPGHTPGIWHLYRPGEEGMWLSKSSRGWGIWSPCVRGREFELHPRFHVKFLAWRAIMGALVLEDFRGKDCAFVANWLQGLCRIWRYLNFNIFNTGFRLWIHECIKLCL